MVKIAAVKDYQEMSRTGAEFVLDFVRLNPHANLALATGGTVDLAYRLMAKDFRGLGYKGHIFNLDEYVGFSEEDEVSNRHFLLQKILNRAGIPGKQVHLIDGKTKNPRDYCRVYERLIAGYGGLDLAILGIGPDGHIANVMPSQDKNILKARTSFVELPPSFVEYHAADFSKLKNPPTHSITMGIGTMYDARTVLMMASGEKKAQAIKDTIEGEISPSSPGSVLRNHKNCIYIIDKDAASLLETDI